ncbi:GGDEF domain-containing protein [Pseudonocardia xinjiangensis]|uniref:sensor domain-containing diguanylate cyclase n=1 Tax=Pseudonocardia xinjiangensis TaxID=75289 RepID=UPI003D8C72EE
MGSDGATETGRPLSRMFAVRRWAIWALPARLLGPVLLVEVTSVALIVLGLAGHAGPTPAQLQIAGVLCLLGIAHTEVAVGVERVRRRVTDGNHVDLSSVWTFAAAVALPPSYAALVAVIVHCHLWWRAWRLRVPLYKQTFTSATVVLACIASATVLQHSGGGTEIGSNHQLWALGLALLAYTTVNSCLVAGAIAVSSPEANLTKVFAPWDENVLEIATLCLGALAAIALGVNPWLVLLVLPPLLVLHRAVLVRQLEEAASTDGKTGLLNAAAWHAQAERALRRASRHDGAKGVLVLDLDHFKSVNDTYGHLAGDQVLAAVAAALRTEVRDRDLVGRFGGEEFVVLLGGLEGSGTAELEAVGERIRRRVANLRVEIPTPDGPLTVAGLTVSVGAALSPTEGADLRTLLQIADAALYTAKRAGRNIVRMGLAVPAQHTTQHAGRLPTAAGEPPAAAG